MNKTVHDKETNTLHIIKDKDEPKVSVPEKELRGFIVVTVKNEQELNEFKEGNQSHIQLSPTLATTEQEAIEIVQSNGQIALSVTSYEFLKLQVSLLEDWAKIKQVNLITLDLFKLENGK